MSDEPVAVETPTEALKANRSGRRRTSLLGRMGKRLSLNRKEQRELENNNIIAGLSEWLTKLTGVQVGNESFSDDLASGVALCRLVQPLGYCPKFNDVKETDKHNDLSVFKKRENFVHFQKVRRIISGPRRLPRAPSTRAGAKHY